MASVSEIEDGIFEIKPENWEQGIPCTCYLVVDDQITLIETGASSQVPEILAGMAKIGYEAASLSYIIPTHIHADHGGGAGYLTRLAPGARVVVHDHGAPHLIDPSKLIEGTRHVFGDKFEDEFGPLLPVPETQILAVQGDEVIQTGERELKIIYSPGHASHHICIYDPKSEGLFCGEALGCYLPEGDMLILAIAPPVFEFALAMDTINRLKQLEPKILFFSQWGISREADKLISLSQEYTKTCGDIILEAMKAGETEDMISQKVGHFIFYERYIKSKCLRDTASSFGAGPLMAYFKREGLV